MGLQKGPLDLRPANLIDQQPACNGGEVGPYVTWSGGIPLLDQAAERILRNVRGLLRTAGVSPQPSLQPITVTAVQAIKVNGGGARNGRELPIKEGR